MFIIIPRFVIGIVLLTSNLFLGLSLCRGFPGGSEGKESACNSGDLGSIPGLGRSPGEENGNPLQYSCLENPMDRGALVGYSPWGCKDSDTTVRPNWTELSCWKGFSGGSDGKEFACNSGDLGSIPGLERSPGGEHGKNKNKTSVFLSGESQGQRSLAGYSLWGHKEWDKTEQLTLSLL